MSCASRPALTLPQQYLFLRSSPICVGEGLVLPTRLTWTYRTRPTRLSREYLAHIEYRKGDVPEVFIRDPDLTRLAKGRKLPHVYSNPTRLCLYLPASDEWFPSMRVDQTFVPWTMTWLFYFEEWLWSDDWQGGGEHPPENDDGRYNRRVRRSADRLGRDEHLRCLNRIPHD